MSGEEQAGGGACRWDRVDQEGPHVPSETRLCVAGASASELRKSVLCLLGNRRE